MTQVFSSGFASSSPVNSGLVPDPIIVQGGLAASVEAPGWDDIAEPPTPEEWRRAFTIIALQVVRELLQGAADRGVLREVAKSATWH